MVGAKGAAALGCLALVGMLGCHGTVETGPRDGSVIADARPVDLGAPDARPTDAGPPRDAGPRPPRDAGVGEPRPVEALLRGPGDRVSWVGFDEETSTVAELGTAPLANPLDRSGEVRPLIPVRDPAQLRLHVLESTGGRDAVLIATNSSTRGTLALWIPGEPLAVVQQWSLDRPRFSMAIFGHAAGARRLALQLFGRETTGGLLRFFMLDLVDDDPQSARIVPADGRLVVLGHDRGSSLLAADELPLGHGVMYFARRRCTPEPGRLSCDDPLRLEGDQENSQGAFAGCVDHVIEASGRRFEVFDLEGRNRTDAASVPDEPYGRDLALMGVGRDDLCATYLGGTDESLTLQELRVSADGELRIDERPHACRELSAIVRTSFGHALRCVDASGGEILGGLRLE